MIKQAFFLLFLPVALFASEITVQLATESELLPVYVASWTASRRDPALTANHLRELQRAIQFDFNYNGTTEVASATPERKAQVSKERMEGRPDAEAWRNLSIAYLLRGHVNGSTLTMKVFAVAGDTNVGVYELPLTGESAADRHRIHQLSDTIHKELFGKPGVASGRLLYTVTTRTVPGEKPRSEVWIADYDGGNPKQLTHEGDFIVTPRFLPPAEGKRSGAFFYVSYKTGQPKIYLAPLDGNAAQPLTPLRGNQLMPNISRDQHHIAFVGDAGGNPDLFLLNFNSQEGAQGKPRQIFTRTASAQASPSFSPDGSLLAFVSNKDGPPRIYIMEVPVPGQRPMSEPHLVTRRNRENTAPAWSPDGKMIAYSAMTRGVRQIWIYETETGEEWQLTQGTSGKENPSWAPDSLHLVFNSATPAGSELYMVNLNQPKAVRLTSGPGEKRFPAWEN